MRGRRVRTCCRYRCPQTSCTPGSCWVPRCLGPASPCLKAISWTPLGYGSEFGQCFGQCRSSMRPVQCTSVHLSPAQPLRTPRLQPGPSPATPLPKPTLEEALRVYTDPRGTKKSAPPPCTIAPATGERLKLLGA